MGKRRAPAKKRVVKKKEEEVVDDVAVSDDESPDDKPAKNGNDENSEDDLHEDDVSENEVEEKVKEKVGRGRPAAKGKKAVPKSAKGKKRGRTTTPAPTKKSKKDEESDVKSDEDEEKEYEVEKILEVRFRKGGKREFSIQWKGYGPKKATWEPEENLECQDLLDNFLSKLGDLKTKDAHELRVNRKQTQPYMDSNRNKGVRSSRRFTSKPRTTYHGQDE